MDPYKKTALIKWLDALTDKKTESFNDVRDGTRLVTILKAFDDHFLPSDTPVGTVEERFVAIRTYLEGFYHQSLSDTSLVNFDMLIQNTVHGPVYDWELGKLLLALLGALVQDKYREQFVNPAFQMDKRSQVELKTMIESVLFMNELETQLPKEFDEVLKRRTDTTLENDAAWFLKQVADGTCLSPQVDCRTTTAFPQANDKGPVVALYTNSPGGAVASPGMSVREINSPFRVMSLNSPQASATSPLGALMQSPQLAQKIIQRESDKRRESEALLRQKMTEIKRLETSLQHQEHRRSEMQLDLEDRAQDLKEKEKRIRDLERQVGEMRSLRDDLDELEQLKVDNDRMTKDNTKLQAKLSEYQGIKEHCQALEREHKEVLDEVQQTRKEQKEINALRWKEEEMQCELSRVQLLMKEQEVEIKHRNQQNAELTQSLEDARSRYTIAQQQIAALKTEKEELEEVLGTRHGMNGLQSPLGESMNVVVEKRLAELQEEYEKMRTTWVDPDQHHKIKKELESISQANQTIEAKYIESTKKVLALEDKISKLSASNKMFESSCAQLETNLQEMRDGNNSLQSKVDTLTENQASLEKTVSELQSLEQENTAKIGSMEKELSQCRTELVLTGREVETQQEACETRRQTIAQLDSEKLEQTRAQQRLSLELSSWKGKAEAGLQQVAELKKELSESEGKLKKKMEELQQLEKQLVSETDLLSAENEVWKSKAEEFKMKLQTLQTESDNKIKSLQNSEVQLSEELSESKAKVQKLEQENNQFCSDLDQWKCKNEDTEEKLQRLQTVSCERSKTFEIEEKKLLNELNVWKDRLDETTKQLNVTVNEVNSRDEMITAGNAKLQQLEQRYYTEVDQLNSELKTWKSKFSRETDESARAKVELSDEIKRLQQSEFQLNSELEVWKAKVDKDREQIKCLRNEMAASEEKLKAKIEYSEHRLTVKETQIIENENEISNLKTKIDELECDLKETKRKGEDDRKLLTEKLEKVENKLKTEQNTREDREEQIKLLSEEVKESKNNAQCKEESLQTELNSLLADKKSLELDLHKTKLELQSANDLYNSKFQKSELKYKDSESAFTQEIEKLNETLKEQYQVEKGLRVEVSKLNQLITKYKEEIEKLTKALEKSSQENKGICGELEESKLQTVNLQVKVKNLQEQFDHECEQNLTALKKKDSSIRELEKRLETTVNDLGSEKTELSEQINSLHQSVAEKSKECLLQKETMLEDMRLLKVDHERFIMEMNDKNRGLISEKDVQLDNIKSELDNVKETMAVKIAELEQTLKIREQSLDKKKMECETLTQEKDSAIAKLKESAAELELKFSTYKEETAKEKGVLNSELEKAKVLQAETEANLNSEKESGQSDIANLKEKLFETEHYWRSQCEQLEEEYSKGASEQKEEYNAQLSAAEEKFEDKLQQLSDEKDMFIANQQQAYMERIHGLERAISEKKEEIHNSEEENRKLRDNFNEERTKLEKQVEGLSGKLNEESEKHRIKCEELESVQQEIVSLRENHVAEVERLVCHNKVQLEALRQSLGCENTGVVKELTEQHDSEVNKLRAENEEQKTQYQGMISDLEGRLDSETLDLKERLSQMKCQYETVIETNQKENKNQNREWEKKITEARNKVTDLENQLREQAQTAESLQNQCSNYTSSNSELQSSLDRLQVVKTELEVKLSNTEVNMNNLSEKLETLETDLIGAKEDVNRERGEREETERQLSYLRDQNDTLSAELSSQQQQLAAVEEEKRVLEAERTDMRASHTSSLEDLRVQSEKDLKFSNIEKMELERQLQSSQKCYEAVQKSEHELESQVEKLREEKSHAESRQRELEQRVFSLMEREKKIMEDNQHQVDKAAELNGTLRRQLDEKCHEVTELNNRFTKEVESMQEQFSCMKQTYEGDIRRIREDKNRLETEAASLDKVKEKLKETEAERKKLQDINEKYNIHYNKKKETIVSLTQELDERRQEVDELTRSNDKLVKDVAPLREKYDGELMRNKGLTNKVRTLEAQLDLADRKIREYQSQLEKSSQVFLGDNSEFMRMIHTKENAADASFMENHPSSGPFHEPDEVNVTAYNLRSRQSFLDQTTDSVGDDTLTPGTRASRSRLRQSKSASSMGFMSNGMTPGAASIGSASSLAYRLRSRESAVSLTSVDSVKSTTSAVPRGTGGMYECEDEPVDFEWGRLSELQRRNTLCLPHLKTSYPVETQTCKQSKFREDALRESTMGNVTLQTAEHGSGRKRKHQQRDSSSSDSSDNRSKLAKPGAHGTVYQKPGPPTPANQRRNSGKGTSSKSPTSRRNSGKGSKSPRTPLGLRGRRTPGRRTPKNTPKRAAAMVNNVENTGSGQKASKRESVAFNVGFSPLSNKKSLRRQQGFIQKQPQSSSQTQAVPRKPLGVRNFLQTGV